MTMYSFDTASESAVFLVGLAFLPEVDDDTTPPVVVTGSESQYEAPSNTRPLLEYLTVPRAESDVRQWIRSAGGTADVLDRLTEAGKVIIVPPAPAHDLLNALRGFRLFSNCRVVDCPEGQPRVEGVAFVGDPSQPDFAIPIATLLASVMWHSWDSEDFPSALQRIAPTAGLSLEQAVEEVAAWLPGLLGSTYGFFAPLPTEQS